MMSSHATFSCPRCGAHDYGLWVSSIGDCPSCLKRDAARYRFLKSLARPAECMEETYIPAYKPMRPVQFWAPITIPRQGENLTPFDDAVDEAMNSGSACTNE